MARNSGIFGRIRRQSGNPMQGLIYLSPVLFAGPCPQGVGGFFVSVPTNTVAVTVLVCFVPSKRVLTCVVEPNTVPCTEICPKLDPDPASFIIIF